MNTLYVFKIKSFGGYGEHIMGIVAPDPVSANILTHLNLEAECCSGDVDLIYQTEVSDTVTGMKFFGGYSE